MVSLALLRILPILLMALHAGRDAAPRWYKGNLHTHSYWSDGDEFPEMVMAWYKEHGYNFVALSDHNILATGEKWIKVPRSRMYEDAFRKYLEKYGERVTYREDSGRIMVRLKTLAEYRPLFEDDNFLIIKSEEITDDVNGKPVHINATNIQSLIQPQHGGSVLEAMQRNVDAVLDQRLKSGTPMFPHINHPNFHYAITISDLIALRGERFFEVYNGHPYVNNYGDSLHPGTEEMWDMVNIAYARSERPLLMGLATDDSHNYHQFGAAFSNAGRGWVMVRAGDLKPASLVTAMEAGDFYSTTGVILEEVEFRQNELSVRVRPEPQVSYRIEFIGARVGDNAASLLQASTGPHATFRTSADFLFVRARVTSDKLKENPFRDRDVEVAWTQPVRPK